MTGTSDSTIEPHAHYTSAKVVTDNLWTITGLRNGWTMLAAPWWKRLPVVRHVRVMIHAARLIMWQDFWVRAGYVPSGYDDWVLHGMWRGWESRNDD